MNDWCAFIESISLQELNALVHQNPDRETQKQILDHIFDNDCSCAKKLQACSPVTAEEGFLKNLPRYLASGQKSFAAFRIQQPVA